MNSSITTDSTVSSVPLSVNERQHEQGTEYIRQISWVWEGGNGVIQRRHIEAISVQTTPHAVRRGPRRRRQAGSIRPRSVSCDWATLRAGAVAVADLKDTQTCALIITEMWRMVYVEIQTATGGPPLHVAGDLHPLSPVSVPSKYRHHRSCRGPWAA